MLRLPEHPVTHFTLVGLDPGSTTFGIAVLTIDIDTMSIASSIAWTINGEKLAGKENWVEEIHGQRTSKIKAIEDNLYETFRCFNPIVVASESPFINSRFPAAGVALTEVLSCIRNAVMRYDSCKRLYLIPPSSVKNGIGSGGAAGKLNVRDSVLALPDLNYNGLVPIEQLDEHSLDALAVAYTKFKQMLEN